MKNGMQNTGLFVVMALSCMATPAAETWKLQDGKDWQSMAGDPQQRYLLAISQLKELARAGDTEDVKNALAQIKEEFPQRFGPDLELFAMAELEFWKDRYANAMVKYEKLMKDHPGSEFAGATMDREFEIASAYLAGRKKSVLGLFRIRGYAEGVEIMERLSDRAGLDEPNSVGLKAAIAVAEHYEARQKYIEAYLKWSEIASYWEMGPIGKKAILRMAEDNFAAYNKPPERRQPLLDASKLTTAKTYYERFALRYPEDAAKYDIPAKLKQIDEQMAYKQYTIGRFYQRTKRIEAADFYYNMVTQNWPDTEAAGMAKQARQEIIDRKQTHEE
jgi:outer membrane protein assembly factor BamD (BamD/ComL family)